MTHWLKLIAIFVAMYFVGQMLGHLITVGA